MPKTKTISKAKLISKYNTYLIEHTEVCSICGAEFRYHKEGISHLDKHGRETILKEVKKKKRLK